MNKMYFSLACMIMAALLTIAAPYCYAAGIEDLYILSEDSAPPYAYKEHGQGKGIDHDIIIEAAKRLNIRVRIDFVPWRRMYDSIENGTCDAGSTFFHIKSRESFAIYVNPPLHFSTYAVFVRKGNEFPYSSLESLAGKKVGVTRGYRLSTEFKHAVEHGKIHVEEVETIAMNIRKVAAGRLDCMVSNLDATHIELKRAGLLGRVVPLPIPVMESRGLHLVFSKAGRYGANRQFIARLEAVLEGMKEDGTFRKIYDSYGLP